MLSINYLFKEIWAEKTRLFLTILAVAWGTASIASMLAVGEGLRITFGQAAIGAGRNIVVVSAGQTSKSYHGQAINQKVQISRDDVQMLKNNLPDMIITPEYTVQVKMRYQKDQNNAMISAVEPLYASLRNIHVQAGGRLINDIDNQKRTQVIVLGNDLATQIFKNENPLNKILYIENKPFHVIGVMQQKLQMWAYQMPDAYLAWIPANTYIDLAQPQYVMNLIVVPKKNQSLDLLKQQFTHLMALKYGYDPKDDALLIFQDSREMQKENDKMFSGMEIFLGIVGGLTLLIAGVGIANVMFVAVKRATREIGIRMAIGARSYQIMLHYVLQSLVTTAIGGACGIFIAKLIVMLINMIPVKGQMAKFMGVPKPVLSPLVLGIVILTLGLIGFFAGFFPARKASEIEPARALRYE